MCSSADQKSEHWIGFILLTLKVFTEGVLDLTLYRSLENQQPCWACFRYKMLHKSVYTVNDIGTTPFVKTFRIKEGMKLQHFVVRATEVEIAGRRVWGKTHFDQTAFKYTDGKIRTF